MVLVVAHNRQTRRIGLDRIALALARCMQCALGCGRTQRPSGEQRAQTHSTVLPSAGLPTSTPTVVCWHTPERVPLPMDSQWAAAGWPSNNSKRSICLSALSGPTQSSFGPNAWPTPLGHHWHTARPLGHATRRPHDSRPNFDLGSSVGRSRPAPSGWACCLQAAGMIKERQAGKQKNTCHGCMYEKQRVPPPPPLSTGQQLTPPSRGPVTISWRLKWWTAVCLPACLLACLYLGLTSPIVIVALRAPFFSPPCRASGAPNALINILPPTWHEPSQFQTRASIHLSLSLSLPCRPSPNLVMPVACAHI